MKKILLVDDDKITNFVNEKLIHSLGIASEIKTCYSGLCAIEYIKDLFQENKTGPNLVLLDINMPIMNGFEFLNELELLPGTFSESIKIIMLSSTLDEEDRSQALKFKNVVDFLNKPLSLDKLKEIIEKYL